MAVTPVGALAMNAMPALNPAPKCVTKLTVVEEPVITVSAGAETVILKPGMTCTVTGAVLV